jgi:hypothetical protein
MDASILSLCNSRERETEDWKAMFARADHRFANFRADRIADNRSTGIISAVWLGDQV